MKRWVAVVMGSLVAACGSTGSGDGSTGAPPAASGAPAAAAPGGRGMAGPATVEGAKAVIVALQNATDLMAEARKLTPGAAELGPLFSDAAVTAAVVKHAEGMLPRISRDAFPPGEPRIFCASTDDVKAWTDAVDNNLPADYKRIGPKLNGGHTLCRSTIGGVAFDALVNVSGKWYVVPRLSSAVKE